jgi:hypothetical protein
MRNYETAGLRAIYDAALVERARLTLNIAKIRKELKRRAALEKR